MAVAEPPAWTVRVGGSGTDQIYAAASDSGGNLIMAGAANTGFDAQSGFGANDAFVSRLTSSGTRLWTRMLGTSSADAASGVAIGSSDSIFVTGYMRGSVDGQPAYGLNDIWLAKYDTTGARLWSRLLGGTGTDAGNAIAVRSGAVYVAGVVGRNVPGSNPAGRSDAVLARYDESGALAWAKSFGSSEDDAAAGVAVDSEGNVYVCGTAGGALPGATALGGKDLFLARYDGAGSRSWIKQVGTAADDSATGVAVGADGGIYVSGTTAGSLNTGTLAGSTDALLLKFDASGAVTWTRQLGSPALDEALAVTTDEGAVYLTGRSRGQLPGANSAAPYNAFAAKYGFDGTLQTVREYSGGNAAGDSFGAGVVASAGRLIVAGATAGSNFDGVPGLGGVDGIVLSLCSGHGFACVLAGNCGTNNGGCASTQTCTPDETGFVQCGCASGYTGSMRCTEVNECLANNGGCDPLTTCTNTVGGRTCSACPSGYEGTGATGCVDIDECATNNGGCDPNAICNNTPGSSSCGACRPGFSGTNEAGCVDIDECAGSPCDPLTLCSNTTGSFTCTACPGGYSGDGKTGCADIDECAANFCDPLTACTNVDGSFSCGSCPSGYTGTGATGCVDVDECAVNDGDCAAYQTCTNTVGSRTCGCAANEVDTGVACVPAAPAWTVRVGGSGTDQINAIAMDTGANMVVVGATNTGFDSQSGFGANDAFVTRYTSSGTKLWTRLLGTSSADMANGVAIGSGNSIFVTGYMKGSVDGQAAFGLNDIWLSKYDTSGARLWSRLLGGNATDSGNAVAARAGVVYVVGAVGNALPGSVAAGRSDVALAGYDEDGTLQWSKSFGSSQDDAATGVAADAVGNVYVCGTAGGALPGATAAGGRDIFLARYDASGNRLWLKQIGTAADDQATGVALGADGGIYVSGTTAGGLSGALVGATDAVLVKFEPGGAVVWTRQLGSPAVDEALAVAADESAVFITGRSLGQLPGANAAAPYNVFAARYALDGTLVTVREYSAGNAAGDSVGAGAVAAAGRLLVAGRTTGSNFDGVSTLGGADGVLLSLCSGNNFACQQSGDCSVGNGGCTATQICTPNGAGRVLCDCGSGYTGSTRCTEVNECLVNNGGCDPLTACTNTVGSRTCGACPGGYSGTGATGCVDIDECATNNGGCDPNAVCTNTPGSSTCGACRSGFSGTSATGCVDIDECATNNGDCDPRTTCTNSTGSYSCGACPPGFTGTGATGCVDTDECATNNGGCDELTTCTNTPGSYTCGECPPTYFGTGLTGCTHNNVCGINNGGCDANAACTPLADGSAQCACGFGYTGTGASCAVDACAMSGTGCSSTERANALVAQVAEAMSRFHAHSGYWPFANTVWSPEPGYALGQIDAFYFIGLDTTLNDSSPPTAIGASAPLPVCAVAWPVSGPAARCWNGPYVTPAASMDELTDPWGNPLYYTYVRPFDGFGGGVFGADDGFVLLWSSGPDGVDQTGCSWGTCGVDYQRLRQGLSSLPFCGSPDADPDDCSDDLVTLVGAAR